MSQLKKDETLLHYEELGGIDYKITITTTLVTEYLKSIFRISYSKALIAAKGLKDPDKGWEEVIGYDERFYQWCKGRFYSKAMHMRSDGKPFVLVTMEKGMLKKKQYPTFRQARADYRRLAAARKSAAIYQITIDGNLYLNPIRKNRAEEIIELIKPLVGQPYREQIENTPNKVCDEAEQCRKRRQISSCEKCLRYLDCDTRRKQQ